jgi:hypothetical protein
VFGSTEGSPENRSHAENAEEIRGHVSGANLDRLAIAGQRTTRRAHRTERIEGTTPAPEFGEIDWRQMHECLAAFLVRRPDHRQSRRILIRQRTQNGGVDEAEHRRHETGCDSERRYDGYHADGIPRQSTQVHGLSPTPSST